MLEFLSTCTKSLRGFAGGVAHMEPDEARQKPGLFAQCSFVIVQHDALDEDKAKKLVKTIQLHEGNATIHKSEDPPLSLEGVTHIISATFDFQEYDTACDAFIPVVKPTWIEGSLGKDKLANPRSYSPDPRLFMSDVVVCCADIPEGDSDAIIGGVLAMGGLFSYKMTGQVTHLVALTMESDKCRLVESKKLSTKIVLPHWFDDCLRLGKRIDEEPYLLPDPEILRHPNDVAPRGSEAKHLSGAIHPDPSTSAHLNQLHSVARINLDVFKKKNVMLSKDLGIGSHLRGVIEDLITSGGAKLTTSVRKADMYVCKFREGEDYIQASQLGKDVGNLAWLYYLLTNNVWTSPTRRLLHYPVARHGIPEFRAFRISLSNYSGEARVYLENLINAAGAECTKTLKQDNTHLITAHTQSEKCAAARDWGIHVINHLWLEESYAKWKIQSVTDPRFTYFPKRTNLGEVVGQTRLDRNALERNFFARVGERVEGQPGPRAMQAKDQNALATPMNNNDVVGSLSRKPPESKNAKRNKDVRNMGEQARYRTPAASKFVPIGKENETPGTSGTRKSKEAAAARLQELTPDIQLYEREKKRVGGVIYGGRRKTDTDRAAPTRKRSLDHASDTEEVEMSDAKKVKTSPLSPQMHLLISGYKKWVGQAKLEERDKKQLRALGIQVVFDPSRASHLAAPNVLRTAKFVTSIAYAPVIISTQFIDDCLEQDTYLDPDDYLLEDQASEKKHVVSLQLACKRAKENRHQLLAGRTIFCMENVTGGFDTFRVIIEVNGGQCLQYTGRKGVMVPSRRADSDASTSDDDPQTEVLLISNPDQENTKLWSRFRQMAEGSRKIPKVVKPDWLLETAMCQKILSTSNYEI